MSRIIPKGQQNQYLAPYNVIILARQIARRFQVSADSVQPVFVGLSADEIEELGGRFDSLKAIRTLPGDLMASQLCRNPGISLDFNKIDDTNFGHPS